MVYVSVKDQGMILRFFNRNCDRYFESYEIYEGLQNDEYFYPLCDNISDFTPMLITSILEALVSAGAIISFTLYSSNSKIVYASETYNSDIIRLKDYIDTRPNRLYTAENIYEDLKRSNNYLFKRVDDLTVKYIQSKLTYMLEKDLIRKHKCYIEIYICNNYKPIEDF